MERSICSICKCWFLDDNYDNHVIECMKNPLNYLLSDYQKCAIKYCKNKSKICYKETRDKVKELLKNNGYDIISLDLIRNHVKNVPLIIHFNFDNLGMYFESDFKYKNCFEIHNGKGDTKRKHIEDFLFNKIYGSVTAKEKVKYGCLNLYLSKHGVTSAKGYGDAYMVLKNDVKNRTSFVVGDSFGKPMYISTFDYFDQMLLSLLPTTINNILCVISKKQFIDDSYQYVEAQIHGDVVFNRDIDYIMLPERYKNSEQLKYIKNLQYDFF